MQGDSGVVRLCCLKLELYPNEHEIRNITPCILHYIINEFIHYPMELNQNLCLFAVYTDCVDKVGHTVRT